MFKFRLGSDETFLILAPRWADLGAPWQIGLLALLLVVPVGLIVWLYRWELRLVERWQACGLLGLRLLILFVLWFAVGLQPRLADIHVAETPGRVRIAVDLSSSMDVADSENDGSRRAIVEKILAPHGANLLQRLADRHQVEIVGFHQDAIDMQPAQLLEQLAHARKDIVSTNLNLPLAKTATSRDNPLLGIVLFSDGQHNVGPAPFSRADELGKERIPIHPVVIGAREPPSDLMILDVQAPTKVFKDATARIEIRVKVTNLPPQDLTVEMQFEGKPAEAEHRKIIKHLGKDEIYSVRFQPKMDEAGTHLLSIKATSQAGKEITLANNVATRVIRVAEDKAKVLLIDGEARWEYHYLAAALQRDPTIALDRIVFSQPRIGAIKIDELDKAGLAKTKLPEAKERDPLLDFECILLGDVSPEELPVADRRRLEKYVAERGGTLILIAGKRYLPLAFAKLGDDPLAKMLPITAPTELKKETGFTLRVTGEGKLRPFLQLEPDQSAFTWPDLPKHFWGVVGKRKPGAAVLLAPAMEGTPPHPRPLSPGGERGEEDTGILVQQNYGFGRVLFMGLDSTWRWRFRVGDTYHHRFWGQLVRWSAADKLLPAGTRFVRYGPREPVYAEGQEVELAVRLNETLPPLTNSADARMKLFRKNAEGGEETIAVIPLTLHPRQPNLLEAKVRDLTPGVYRVELDIPQYRVQLAEPPDEKDAGVKGRDLFRVLPRAQTELLDLSTNWPLMQSLAERSDGKLYTPENVEEIVERLARRIERTEDRKERRPWEDREMVWWMLGVLLGLLTTEWVCRRWLELA